MKNLVFFFLLSAVVLACGNKNEVKTTNGEESSSSATPTELPTTNNPIELDDDVNIEDEIPICQIKTPTSSQHQQSSSQIRTPVAMITDKLPPPMTAYEVFERETNHIDIEGTEEERRYTRMALRTITAFMSQYGTEIYTSSNYDHILNTRQKIDQQAANIESTDIRYHLYGVACASTRA